MNRNEAMSQLSQMFKGLDWFYEVDLDQYGRIVVYAHRVDTEIYNLVPTKLGEFQILLHFATNKTATREQFTSNPNAPGATLKKFVPEVHSPSLSLLLKAEEYLEELDEVVGPEEEEKSLSHLQKELDELERACGSFTLSEILF